MSSHNNISAAIADAQAKAQALDGDDSLAFTRSEFNIPTKTQIASTRLPDSGGITPSSGQPCNSDLGN